MTPPRRLKQWTDADVPAEVSQGYKAIFERLYGLQPHNGENGRYEPLELPLSDAAKALFVGFYNDHAREQAELPSELDAAWSKLEAYVLRLALVLHCIRQADGDPTLKDPLVVDDVSMANAIGLVQWFKGQTRRSYAILNEDERQQAKRELIEMVRRKGGRVTARDVCLSSRRYRTTEDAEKDLDELVTDGVGTWEPHGPGSQGGRPTRVFVLTGAFKASQPPTSTTGAGSRPDRDTHESADGPSQPTLAVPDTDAGNGTETPEVTAALESSATAPINDQQGQNRDGGGVLVTVGSEPAIEEFMV